MNKYYLPLFFLLTLTFSNCKQEDQNFPLDKRYWDIEDYDTAVLELKYGYKKDEPLPTFDNPESSLIVEKLTDHQNYKVVLDDKELGLNYRNEVASKFFTEWKSMNNVYSSMDRKDQYRYEKEFLAVWHFGLGLQLKYFKLGNDQITQNADDPDSSSAKRTITSNVNTLIKNYLIYLDEVDNESAFSENGKKLFAEGIETYFTALIELYPDADYSPMKKKATLLLNKSKSAVIKNSLKSLIERLK